MTADITQPPAEANIRDAVHVAVISQVADRKLKAGERRALGVVDPFGALEVKKGELYWLYLTPGTVANLRHEWDHPDLEKGERKSTLIRELEEEIERLNKKISDDDYDYGGCRGC